MLIKVLLLGTLVALCAASLRLTTSDQLHELVLWAQRVQEGDLPLAATRAEARLHDKQGLRQSKTKPRQREGATTLPGLPAHREYDQSPEGAALLPGLPAHEEYDRRPEDVASAPGLPAHREYDRSPKGVGSAPGLPAYKEYDRNPKNAASPPRLPAHGEYDRSPEGVASAPPQRAWAHPPPPFADDTELLRPGLPAHEEYDRSLRFSHSILHGFRDAF